MQQEKEPREQCKQLSTKPVLNIGDHVIHKLTGHKMTIKSISGTVARCSLDNPKKCLIVGEEIIIDEAVSSIYLLIKIQ